MTFSHPGWLAAGMIACLCLIGLWRRHDARQHAALTQFVSAHLRAQLTQSVSILRRRAQRGLLLASVALLFVALAGPLAGYRWELISRRGNEVVFALDTSRSMSTPDVNPDRLTRAKLAIEDFTHKLGGDALGLVAFAGDAFLVCPITLDHGAFHESLNAVDVNTIPRGGTNISSAIREAQAALRRRPGSDKILILVTDGEDLEGDAVVAAQAAARHDNLKIYTIGVGTSDGDLIPLTGAANGGFVKDESGGFVKSRLDEPALKAIATATGGLYAPLGAQGEGFESIYTRGLAPALKHDLASRRQRVYTERYQWPLAGSLGLLLASLLIGSRRRVASGHRRPSVPRPPSVDPAAISVLGLLLLAFAPANSTQASAARAEQAYRNGDYVAAAKAYAAAAKRDPLLPELQFNFGTAAYRAGEFAQAAQAFQDSISRAPSADARRLADQQDAYYNLGNTLYRTGQKTEQSAPERTLQTWNQALLAYDTALQLRRDDADSKFNRDLVTRKIAELKQKQNQQSNQQKPSAGAPPPAQQPPANEQSKQQQPIQQSPSSAGQSSPSNGPPKTATGQGTPPPGGQIDAQRLPGEMSPEEARELLDSQKGEERRALGLPLARRQPDTPPEKPRKDW
ncbi:MAG: hypothetical protein NVS9B2_01190 [Steroidobacteraceae bacterium]